MALLDSMLKSSIRTSNIHHVRIRQYHKGNLNEIYTNTNQQMA